MMCVCRRDRDFLSPVSRLAGKQKWKKSRLVTGVWKCEGNRDTHLEQPEQSKNQEPQLELIEPFLESCRQPARRRR